MVTSSLVRMRSPVRIWITAPIKPCSFNDYRAFAFSFSQFGSNETVTETVTASEKLPG